MVPKSQIFNRLKAASSALRLLKSKNDSLPGMPNRAFTFSKPTANSTEIAAGRKKLTFSAASIMSGALLFLYQHEKQKNEERKMRSESLKIDRNSGLLNGIPFYEAPFPNSEDRPDPEDVSLLVIHDTEIVAPDDLPYYKSIVHYMFTQQYDLLKKEYSDEFEKIFPGGKTRDVAAHIVIRRNGEIIQYVPFNKLAHHAGVSEFENREVCNTFSIGIELEGFANRPDFPYTEAQYQTLAILTKAIMETYPKITWDRITSHEAIARPIGRKTDPGKTFDWEKYKKLVFLTDLNPSIQLSNSPSPR